jgi:hypothetical protein
MAIGQQCTRPKRAWRSQASCALHAGFSVPAAFAGLEKATVGGAQVNQLTRTMAVEWGPFNVQVNAVCPTVILTDVDGGLLVMP